jgi:hypothetical protein
MRSLLSVAHRAEQRKQEKAQTYSAGALGAAGVAAGTVAGGLMLLELARRSRAVPARDAQPLEPAGPSVTKPEPEPEPEPVAPVRSKPGGASRGGDKGKTDKARVVTIASPPILVLPGDSDLYTEEPQPQAIVQAEKIDLALSNESDEPIVPEPPAVVPLFSDPKREMAHVASAPPPPQEEEDPAPQEEPETQMSSVPHTERRARVYKEAHFDLAEKAGSGGSKVVYYIEKRGGDWVLALPNESGTFDGYWPNMVREELHMSEQLQELGIPCLEMHGVMSTNLDEAKGAAVPALLMRSFDYYRRTKNSVVMETKNAKYAYFSGDQMDDVLVSAVNRSAQLAGGEREWGARAADALVALLIPLAKDIKKLAEHCIGLGTDSLNWQVVFEDDTLEVPSEIRVFLFDLTSKGHETESILAGKETMEEKRRKASFYLSTYFADINPFSGPEYRTPEYRKLKRDVLARLSAVAHP